MKQEVVTVGVDLAKSVFQVHAIGRDGAVLVRRKLRRAELIGFFADLPVCLVGMEACASVHHWARGLLALGHEVRLMPPRLCEALCEAREDRCSRRRGNLRGGLEGLNKALIAQVLKRIF